MSETLWDAPNQQVVRADNSGPGVDEGGSAAAPESNPLDSMTKDQLVAYAAEHGIDVDASTTKAEIRATIDAAGG